MGTSAIFPLENPGIVSIPLSFVVTVLLSIRGQQ
jgi:Na+(H+)/acetate symporter ActP